MKTCAPSSEEISGEEKKVTFASSDNLYHFGLLWSDDVKKGKDDKQDDGEIPDLACASDSASNYSAGDDSSVSSEKSLASALNVDPKDSEKLSYRPKIVGHRGAVYHEPENTLASFQTASDLGAEAVELDVFLLKCGSLAVFHGDGGDKMPGGLKKYCDVDGSIMHCTAEEARELEFSPDGDAHFCPSHKLESASIPMLDEVLEHAKKEGFDVKIELKGPNTEEPVLELVDKFDMVDQCTFSSFYHDRIEKVRTLRPQRHSDGAHVYRTGALFSEQVPDDFIQCAQKVGATEIHLRYDTCTRERIDAIHEAGFGSMAWMCGPISMGKHLAEKYHDVEDEDEAMYDLVLQSGVQAMCVNRPDRLVNLVSSLEAETIDGGEI